MTEDAESVAFLDEAVDPVGIDPQEALDAVTVTIGLVGQEPGEMLHDLPPEGVGLAPGEIVQVRGQIKEKLADTMIVLERDEPTIENDRELLVLFDFGDVTGAGADVGRYALVQGELVRVSPEYHQTLLDHGVSADELSRYEGQLVIVTRAMAH